MLPGAQRSRVRLPWPETRRDSVRRIIQLGLVLGLVVGCLPVTAEAASVTCPTPALGSTANNDNQYTVTNALDCVYGDGNINTNPASDEFLQGGSTVEDSYVAGAPFSETPTFGVTWSPICTSNTVGGTCSGLTYTTNAPGGGTTGTWGITNTSFLYYALGIADGAGPKYAVFILDGTSGTMSMVGGTFSHFTLYGFGTPTTTDTPPTTDTPVPEPASLLLLGVGLGFAGQRLRRRQLSRV